MLYEGDFTVIVNMYHYWLDSPICDWSSFLTDLAANHFSELGCQPHSSP
jgi:hypothetical protein